MKKLKYPSGIEYNAISQKEIDTLVKSNVLIFNNEECNYHDSNGNRFDNEEILLSEIPIGDTWIDPDNTKYIRISPDEFNVLSSIFDVNDINCPLVGDVIPIKHFLFDNDGNRLKENKLLLYDTNLWYLI